MGVKAKSKSFKAVVSQLDDLSVREDDYMSVLGGTFPGRVLKQAGFYILTDGECPDEVWNLVGKRVRITILD